MQFNGTPLMDRASASPVITAPTWFEEEGRPFVLRMEHPLSFDEMVAALYRDPACERPDDLATAEDIWGHIAVTVTNDGLIAIQRSAEDIERDEARGRIANPDWLEFCRQQVAALLSGQVTR